ncbi:hypothetical protein C8R44DRAFT_974126 [Mycena epipterygia]|nr:hypothetical protein C8R44DRAFT_974126 [Mycena epipterygia]
MVDLAQELIDAIVDQLGQKDTWCSPKDITSLRACALAARSFVAPSQRHLFRSLTLTSEKMQKVAAGIIENPRLGSFVRDLRIEVPFTSSHFDTLASLLPLLNRIDRLVIAWQNWDWKSFPANFRGAFVGLLSIPSLRCLAFTYCSGIPPSILRHALASYHEVVFTNIAFSEPEKFRPFAEEASRPPTGILGYLVLAPKGGSEDTTLRTLVLGQEIAPLLVNLEHLELGVAPGGSLGGLEKLALNCSGAIRHLTINFDKRHDDIISLPNMPSLRFLTLKSSVRKFRVPYSVLSVAVSLPACMPRIEVLDFVVDAEFRDYRNDHHRADVDEALRDLQHLREVRFTVTIWDTDLVTVEEDIRKKLPMANDAGLISLCAPAWAARYHPMCDFSN